MGHQNQRACGINRGRWSGCRFDNVQFLLASHLLQSLRKCVTYEGKLGQGHRKLISSGVRIACRSDPYNSKPLLSGMLWADSVPALIAW